MEEVVAYILAEVEMRHVQVRERELSPVVRHVIVQEMREDGGVDAITRRSCQIHVEDVEHEQAHEEKLKAWHRFLQRPHQRRPQDGIGEAPEEDGKAILLDVYAHAEREIHQHAIGGNTEEGDAEELPNLPFLDFQPVEVEQDADIHARKHPHILRLLGQLLQLDYFAVEYLLHRMLGTEGELGKDGDDKDWHHIAEREGLELYVWVAVVAKAVKEDARKHDGYAEQDAHVQTVEPHVIIAIHHDVG